MQNLSDNELDDLFRNASKQRGHTGEDVTSDWAKLAERLDDHGNGAGFWKAGAVILSAVIIGGIGLTIWISEKPLNQSEVASDIMLTVQESQEKELSNTNELKSVERQEKMDIVRGGDKPHGIPKLKKEFVNSQAGLDVENSDVPAKSSIQSNPTLMLADNLEGELSTEPENFDGQKDREVEDREEVETEILTGSDYKSAWSIKLAASPDYSSVGYTSPGKTGWNYGAMLEYHFSKRLSVASGVIRSKKLYETSQTEYQGIKVEDLQGDCRIWDIPLNLYYHFSDERKWSFYTGIGFSSYVMSKENYVYMMDTYYGPHQYELEIKRKNNEWFKMLNLSFGAERQLSSHLAIQVEPFLKAPLAGVGEGDVSLASFGAFISLKYNFMKIL